MTSSVDGDELYFLPTKKLVYIRHLSLQLCFHVNLEEPGTCGVDAGIHCTVKEYVDAACQTLGGCIVTDEASVLTTIYWPTPQQEGKSAPSVQVKSLHFSVTDHYSLT